MHLDDANATHYDALLIPGGYGSPEELRLNKKALEFIKAFAEKPIAAICHGPNILIDAKLIANRKLTSYPAIQQDIINAGGHWIDSAVVIDKNLITSRGPDDLAEFNEAICGALIEYKRKKHG